MKSSCNALVAAFWASGVASMTCSNSASSRVILSLAISHVSSRTVVSGSLMWAARS